MNSPYENESAIGSPKVAQAAFSQIGSWPGVSVGNALTPQNGQIGDGSSSPSSQRSDTTDSFLLGPGTSGET